MMSRPGQECHWFRWIFSQPTILVGWDGKMRHPAGRKFTSAKGPSSSLLRLRRMGIWCRVQLSPMVRVGSWLWEVDQHVLGELPERLTHTEREPHNCHQCDRRRRIDGAITDTVGTPGRRDLGPPTRTGSCSCFVTLANPQALDCNSEHLDGCDVAYVYCAHLREANQ